MIFPMVFAWSHRFPMVFPSAQASTTWTKPQTIPARQTTPASVRPGYRPARPAGPAASAGTGVTGPGKHKMGVQRNRIFHPSLVFVWKIWEEYGFHNGFTVSNSWFLMENPIVRNGWWLGVAPILGHLRIMNRRWRRCLMDCGGEYVGISTYKTNYEGEECHTQVQVKSQSCCASIL